MLKTDSLIILIPVFNDWTSLDLLLQNLDAVLKEQGCPAEVLVIDDGSTIPVPPELVSGPLNGIRRFEIVHLRRNLGHQRAIAIGLAFVHATRQTGAIVVMDGDGEDEPADVPRLVAKLRDEGGGKIIFAERTKRLDRPVFRFFYQIYRMLHRVLTGSRVRFGNFSALPFASLTRLVVVSELWSHYAAAVLKARLPYATISTSRARRLAGKPTMDFASLVVHGLSALAVYGDLVGVRLLAAASVLTLLVAMAFIATLSVRVTTNLAIPGWATYTSLILVSLLLQIVMMTFFAVLMILSSRSNLTFIPARDYEYFIRGETVVFDDE
jgi:glycosyltransferase involved in cell wall biosynthesis